MDFILDKNKAQINATGCKNTTNKKLAVFDWLCDLPETKLDTDFVEVQFRSIARSRCWRSYNGW